MNFARFGQVEIGDIFRTQEGGTFQKLPPVRPEGFMWLFANALNLESRRFAYFGDPVLVKITGREALDMNDGLLTLETADGVVTLETGA